MVCQFGVFEVSLVGGEGIEGCRDVRTVSMYSLLAALGGILERGYTCRGKLFVRSFPDVDKRGCAKAVWGGFGVEMDYKGYVYQSSDGSALHLRRKWEL